MNEGGLVEGFFKEELARRARQNEQLAYWCKFFSGVSYSPKELYEAVVKNIQALELPGLEVGQVLIAQGGPFSPERLYLQLRRERLIFEVCGAPFGNGFFVSSRLFDRRKVPTFFDYVVLFFVLNLLAGCTVPLGYRYGWVWSVIAFTGIIAVAWTLMRLAAMQTLAWLDRVLSDLPFLGGFYERIFRPDTYYRQDLNNSYRDAVHVAVMQAIDEMTKQKGLTALTPEERRPMVRDLSRR